MKLPIPDKETYSISEFATIRKLPYNTVKYWIIRGRIPEAFQVGDGVVTMKRWRIPKEALTMIPPKRGRPFGDVNKGGKMLAQARREAEQLKADRANLFDQLNDIMVKYAGLLGKYDQLLLDYELQGAHVKTITGSLEAELMNVEIADSQIASQRLIIDELKQTIRNREDEIDALRKAEQRLSKQAK